jgi:DNA-binding NarL/FixJ family response regulator
LIKRPIPQILIIDDHPSVRAGIRRALESAQMICCGEAASRDEAIAQIALRNPDGVIVDLKLPDGSGLEVIKWIRKHSQTTAIVMLTMSDEQSHLLAAMKSGASAFVKKSAPLSEVISSLNAALAQPANFTAPGMNEINLKSKVTFNLTAREMSVLKALSLDGANKVLATGLFISEATFKTHVAAIYRKMNVTGRLGAVSKARDFNLL